MLGSDWRWGMEKEGERAVRPKGKMGKIRETVT
jgi:hypothetical protein